MIRETVPRITAIRHQATTPSQPLEAMLRMVVLRMAEQTLLAATTNDIVLVSTPASLECAGPPALWPDA